MGRDDDQVYLFRCRDLDDFVRWRAHDQLASDLDLGSFGLWQHLCEIETGLALQISKQHCCPSWRDKADIRRQCFDDMQEHKLRPECLGQLVRTRDGLFGTL